MEKKKVFVVMPFKDQFFEVYEMLKMEFSEFFEFSNAFEEGNQQNILKDIIQPIYEADIVIADLTGVNPNVMYELGIAHTFNKKTIIITQDELSQLPFDPKQYRAKDYSTHFKKFAELIDYLKKNLNGANDNSVLYGNPIRDFLEISQITNIPWFTRSNVIELNEESDKGYIDFWADIESSTEKFKNTLSEISSEMQEMSNGVSNCTTEINLINKNANNNKALLLRLEIKKAAKYIDTFSSKLKLQNPQLSEQWDEIEKNFLGLFENSFLTKEENQSNLIKNLKSLYGLKSVVPENVNAINFLKSVMQSFVGIERSMTQAVRFVNEDLATYIVFTERLCASIDKILMRSRLIVGDIDYKSLEQ